MGSRQKLACQASFLIQIHPGWPGNERNWELWSEVSSSAPPPQNRFGWGVWGSGRDDSDNNHSRTFWPKALTLYLFNLQLSLKVGCSIFPERESKDFQASPRSQEEPSEGLSNPYNWKWRDQDPSPGKKVKVKSLSHVQLFTTPWAVAYQTSPSMEFSRHEYRNGLPFPSPGDLINPGIEPGSPALQADALPSEPPRNLLALEGPSNAFFQWTAPTRKQFSQFSTVKARSHSFKLNTCPSYCLKHMIK